MGKSGAFRESGPCFVAEFTHVCWKMLAGRFPWAIDSPGLGFPIGISLPSIYGRSHAMCLFHNRLHNLCWSHFSSIHDLVGFGDEVRTPFVSTQQLARCSGRWRRSRASLSPIHSIP